MTFAASSYRRLAAPTAHESGTAPSPLPGTAWLVRSAAAVALVVAALPAAALDVDALSDHASPEASEQRLRAALAVTWNEDDAVILVTQIARSYGLRGDFARAQAMLAAIEPQLGSAEARVRHALETGRTLSSATHAPESQTPEVRARARAAYLGAFELAQAAQLDALAIDALHMMAFVDTAPADQLRWGQQALTLAQASPQPAARKWEAPLRNNVGYALHQLGRYDEALEQFRLALALRERGSDAEATRIAWWMVAWTLRAQARADEALAIQLRLERECDAAGAPDPYVYEELEILYRERGDAAAAARYAVLKARAQPR
jgi:tetratricopeptide (TPR) repeat protein